MPSKAGWNSQDVQKTHEIEVTDGKLGETTIIPWLQEPVLPGCSELRVMYKNLLLPFILPTNTFKLRCSPR
jgi:hypothetical protein